MTDNPLEERAPGLYVRDPDNPSRITNSRSPPAELLKNVRMRQRAASSNTALRHATLA